jgi:F-type H+-transporting ATPase subunit delta
MKITPKQYAQALYDSLKDDNKKDATKAIAEFARVLVENNDLQKGDKIIEQFRKLYNQEEGIVEAEITSAAKLSAAMLHDLKEYIKKISKVDTVEVNEKENRSLVGGAIIKYGDKILDGSLKTRIQTMKAELKK